MTYIVIENTPGYLPEDDDPFVTENYAEAVAYANELADRIEEDEVENWECDRSWASGGNYYAIYCTRPDSEHDLGRYISVELMEE